MKQYVRICCGAVRAAAGGAGVGSAGRASRADNGPQALGNVGLGLVAAAPVFDDFEHSGQIDVGQQAYRGGAEDERRGLQVLQMGRSRTPRRRSRRAGCARRAPRSEAGSSAGTGRRSRRAARSVRRRRFRWSCGGSLRRYAGSRRRAGRGTGRPRSAPVACRHVHTRGVPTSSSSSCSRLLRGGWATHRMCVARLIEPCSTMLTKYLRRLRSNRCSC